MSDIQKLASCMKSRKWRLENLYRMVNEQGQEVPFILRPAQVELMRSFHTYNIVLKARQMGFTSLIDLLGLDMTIFTPNFTMVIIAETKEKATDIFDKKILFPYQHLPPELRNWCKVESCVTAGGGGELAFSNGSVIKVMCSARSGTVQFLHVSEYGPVCFKSPAKAEEIKTGSFPAVHKGGFIFVESTAMGRAGHFYDMVKSAEADMLCNRKLSDQEFKLHFFPWWKNPEYVSDSTITIPDRLLEYFDMLYSKYGIALSEQQQAWYTIMEKTYHEAMWSEYPSYPEEAFKAANAGAYFGQAFEKLYRESRITRVPYEEALPVYTSWDLGVSDDTAIWFFQFCGKEIRVIDYYERNGEGLQHYIGVLNSKPYKYGVHFCPHDIEVRDFSTGVSRRETARKFGCVLEMVPTNNDLLGGIEACRDLLNYCYFDEQKTDAGRKCLENYKKDWDEKAGAYRNRPCHDWTSHGADAFRTMAVAYSMGKIKTGLESRVPIRITGGLRQI